MLEMLHCYYYYISISGELQDVYRCLLIFNLYSGVAGCLWLLSAKELYKILGEILALLESLAGDLTGAKIKPLWICCLLAIFLLWCFF